MDKNDAHEPSGKHHHGRPADHDGSGQHQHGDDQQATFLPRPDHLTATPPQEWMKEIPGDLQQLQHLTTTLGTTAGNIGDQVTRLKAVQVGDFWSGDAATAFSGYQQELPPPLTLAQKRYEGTSQALGTYTTALQDAQQTARRAIQEATEAKAAIEAEGHQVAEWRLYADGHPVYAPQPPQPKPVPVVKPLPDVPVDAAMVAPAQPDLATPPVQPVTEAHGVSRQLLAEFERFGASVKLMQSAIDSYDDAARRCVAGIHKSIDDDLKNTAGYHKSLHSLQHKLGKNLAAIAPELQGQLGKLTGVTKLLGWLPMIAGFSGSNPQSKKTLQQLTKDAADWKAAKGDGKKVVDDFLKLLTADTTKAAAAPAHGHAAPAVQEQITQAHQQGAQAQQQFEQNLQQAQEQISQGVQQAQQQLSQGAQQFQDQLSQGLQELQGGLSQLATHTVPVPAA